MTPPTDNLEGLALELRATAPAPIVDLAAQRRRLERDPRARLRQRFWTTPRVALFGVVAVAVVCLLVLGIGQSRQILAPPSPLVEVTGAGHHAPDGSFVELAPGGFGRVLSSSADDLSYELVSGSAHVSVVPQVGHHWSVSAGAYTVSVIGTAFHVDFRAPNLLVQVEHGIVSVSGGRLSAPVRLEKGARLRVQGDTVTLDRGEPALSDASAAPSVTIPPDAAPTSVAHETDKKTSEDWEASYAAGEYKKAVALAHSAGFERLLTTLPETKLTKLSDAARLGGDEAGARLALQTLQARFLGSAAATRAVFLLGTLDARDGNPAHAIESLQKYLSLAPTGPFASEATGRLMQLYAARGQSQEAEQMAASYLQREPNGPYVRLARSLNKAP